jgi:tetratricopeptide (TPR) repeat protein
MSLLLDALKKAADDKEKRSKDSLSIKTDLSTVDSSVEQVRTEDVGLRATKQDTVPISEEPETSVQSENIIDNKKPEVMAPSKESPVTRQPRVSDDALSMLINKTNREVKKGKVIFLAGVFIASLLITVSGGIYYYMDMESEIESLERKHSISLQAMRSKTSKEQTPDKSEIIRNLVSDSELEEKVKYAKEQMANEKPKNVGQAIEARPKKTKVNKANERVFSIEKVSTADVVGEKLDQAWYAYESARYSDAEKMYNDVLVIEDSNRDALLGLGAIAVIEQNHVKAREIYLSLLDLDPRDPIATAGLAGLHTSKKSLDTDKDYLISMLDKNPDAHHLNFALGNVYAQLDKWVEAQKYYFNAWQQDGDNPDYIFNLAVSMDQLSKEQQAVNFYKDSLVKAANKQVSFSREEVKKRIEELTRL